MSGPGWLERYRGGERALVWHELRQLGAAVREAPHAEEAQAVCDEMALRARTNIEVLVARLTADGYRFHQNNDDQTPATPFLPATAGAQDLVTWLETTVGPIPMVLSSWIRLVGDVWLVGTHPRWESSASGDPLCIEIEGLQYASHDVRSYYAEEHARWRDDPPGEPFSLPVAPDSFHKQNVSGGAPFGFLLPDACADAQFVTTAPTSFVSYLNTAFSSGGFPAFSGDVDEYQVKYSLAQGMLPL